jgi:hypothetical protein
VPHLWSFASTTHAWSDNGEMANCVVGKPPHGPKQGLERHTAADYSRPGGPGLSRAGAVQPDARRDPRARPFSFHLPQGTHHFVLSPLVVAGSSVALTAAAAPSHPLSPIASSWRSAHRAQDHGAVHMDTRATSDRCVLCTRARSWPISLC